MYIDVCVCVCILNLKGHYATWTDYIPHKNHRRAKYPVPFTRNLLWNGWSLYSK